MPGFFIALHKMLKGLRACLAVPAHNMAIIGRYIKFCLCIVVAGKIVFLALQSWRKFYEFN
ncbi:MAG: hypothetical protein EBT10_06400, partial [Methylocystaceae bacterium]|nr:hypothetical protein [Methylocystaceae bacterium]